MSLSAANPVVKANAPSMVQIALNRTPDAVKPAMFRLASDKEWHVAGGRLRSPFYSARSAKIGQHSGGFLNCFGYSTT